MSSLRDCSNKLVVHGEAADLDQFAQTMMRVEQGGSTILFSLDNILLTEPSSSSYEWRAAFWGTKWDCYGIDFGRFREHLVYRFKTIQAPIFYHIFEMMTQKYPRLRFKMLFVMRDPGFIGIYQQVEPREWRKSFSRGTDEEDEEQDEDEDLNETDNTPASLPLYAPWKELWLSSG